MSEIHFPIICVFLTVRYMYDKEGLFTLGPCLGARFN